MLRLKRARSYAFLTITILFISSMLSPGSIYSTENKHHKLYNFLLNSSKSKPGIKLFKLLNTKPETFDWGNSIPDEFKGNLRVLVHKEQIGNINNKKLYFLRKLDGEIFIVSIPGRNDDAYENLNSMMENKMVFSIIKKSRVIDGKEYTFARFTSKPEVALLDRLFKIAIVLMLFFVMVGMGLTLTLKDFSIVFTRPKGVIAGELLQFGIMPLIAVVLGYLMGFAHSYPYIFIGMVLITATPGGVTSNLMTHYAKGDVALSITLTSLSTILSILFVPLLLNAYCSNISNIVIPIKSIISTIVVLVLVPLTIGMTVRHKFENFAKKSTRYFSILGIIALLFLIIAGVMSNLDKFADTERYGFLFYGMVFSLTLAGMLIGAVIPKFFNISNYQVRAISLETGLRNASLAMAIALLIQDSIGDFYSSLFWVSGMFGLAMYVIGALSIKLYKIFLPIDSDDENSITEAAECLALGAEE